MKEHLRVPKAKAQEVISRLKASNALDFSYKITHDYDYVYVPLKSGIEVNKEFGDVIRVAGEKSEEKFLPQKYSGSYDIIGDVIIIKYREGERAKDLAENLIRFRKGVKAVYLDHGVSGQFRTRTLELIAGRDGSETIYKENGLLFKVDVKKVYFSPRLATERLRVAKEVKDGELVIDMFSGVGPFSIGIAKLSNARVISIDSNPEAIELLNENVKMNKLRGSVESICADSSEKIRDFKEVDRIIMNLPHDAYKHVGAALPSLKEKGIINYYEINDVEGIENRMEYFRSIGLELLEKRVVHSYSKYESMYSLVLVSTGDKRP